MPERDHVCRQPSKTPRRISPDPSGHASILVEWFGVPTALAMARFYATDSSAGAYWSDVLANLTARFSGPNEVAPQGPLPRRPSLSSRRPAK